MTLDLGNIASAIAAACAVFGLVGSLMKVAQQLGQLTAAVAQGTKQMAEMASEQKLETERRIQADERILALLMQGDKELHERINYALLTRG